MKNLCGSLVLVCAAVILMVNPNKSWGQDLELAGKISVDKATMQSALDDVGSMSEDLSIDMPSGKSLWNIGGLLSGTHVGKLSVTIEKPREIELVPDEEGEENGKIIVALDITAIWKMKGMKITFLDNSKVKISGRPVYDNATGSLHIKDVELSEIELVPLGGEWLNDTIRNSLNEEIREFGDMEITNISDHPLFELFKNVDVQITIEEESVIIGYKRKISESEVKNNY